jgi:periplasmic protein TonB
MSALQLPAHPPFDVHAPRRSRLPGLAVVAALHVLAVWGLMHMPSVRQALAQAPVLTVSLLSAAKDAAPAPALPAPPRVAAPTPPVAPVPVIERVETPMPLAPAAAPAVTAVLAPPAPAGAASAAVSAPPAPAVAAAPPVERQVQISQVAYLTPPVLSYPLAARRQREQGLVQVRVRVDEQGRPARFAIERSSGHPALDDAALQTVRATRFQPYRENGVAMPFWVVMPLLFELDNS